MASVKGGLLAKKNVEAPVVQEQKKSISAVFNELIDREGMKNRIAEIMQERAPQFTASLVSLVNSNSQMQEVFRDAPVTIIQSALKACTYDLPIDQSLGFAYIVPFNAKDKVGGGYHKEAQFIMSYKGMLQLAMRTGVYEIINVTDVRETELKSWNRLTEEIQIEFIEDEVERNKKKVIGYAGFYKMKTGMTKTIYMSISALDAHEEKHRKGNKKSSVWLSFADEMYTKTVLRKLIGKWGIMSIDYKNVAPAVAEFTKNASLGIVDSEDDNHVTIDTETGEVIPVEPLGDNVPPADIEIPFE